MLTHTHTTQTTIEHRIVSSARVVNDNQRLMCWLIYAVYAMLSTACTPFRSRSFPIQQFHDLHFLFLSLCLRYCASSIPMQSARAMPRNRSSILLTGLAYACNRQVKNIRHKPKMHNEMKWNVMQCG